jgi:hypothetical protein
MEAWQALEVVDCGRWSVDQLTGTGTGALLMLLLRHSHYDRNGYAMKLSNLADAV